MGNIFLVIPLTTLKHMLLVVKVLFYYNKESQSLWLLPILPKGGVPFILPKCVVCLIKMSKDLQERHLQGAPKGYKFWLNSIKVSSVKRHDLEKLSWTKNQNLRTRQSTIPIFHMWIGNSSWWKIKETLVGVPTFQAKNVINVLTLYSSMVAENALKNQGGHYRMP